MPRATDEGRLHHYPRFASSFLSTRRDLLVYLPPGYGEAGARHPVLYLQDGQNLFDPATAFGGRDWGVDVTADNMIRKAEIPPLVIVGVCHTGVRRLSEYTPTRDRKLRKGGKADRYAEMLARELKPFIDREYRTLKPASHTGVGGSSLGALASLAAGLDYPRVFGKLALLSPSVWWDNRAIVEKVRCYSARVRPRIWLDTGTAEGDNPSKVVEDARALRDALAAKGWREDVDLKYTEFEGEAHTEAAWAARFGAVLLYLFGK
jgi:predicted alpha/beta superfamily hydrolase